MSDATDTSTDTSTTDATTDTTSTDATTDTAATTDWKAEAEKWKTFSRKHEEAAKANAKAAAKLAEIEDANATEIEKATKTATQAQTDAAAARAELAVARAALKHGVSEAELADLAEAVGTHGTAEELAARADKLAPRFKAAEPEKKPDFGAGDRGDDVTAAGEQLTDADVKRLMAAGKHDEVTKAKAEGRLNTLLGIK